MKPSRPAGGPREAAAVARDDLYNLEAAAPRCRVSARQVLDRIGRGLRAFPIGSAERYRARDYIILEEWLLDFFRARGVVRRKDGSEVKPKEVEATRTRNRDYPLGPRPV